MFVGHYSVGLAARRGSIQLPLWVWFVAVQWLDFVFMALVLLGVEKMRLTPGFTETNELDLYFMPYSHSLVGAVVISVVFAGLVALAFRAARSARGVALVTLVSFSHWILDALSTRQICRSCPAIRRSDSARGITSRSACRSNSPSSAWARGSTRRASIPPGDGAWLCSLHSWSFCSRTRSSVLRRRPSHSSREPRWRHTSCSPWSPRGPTALRLIPLSVARGNHPATAAPSTPSSIGRAADS